MVFDKDMKKDKDLSCMTNKSTGITSRFRRDRNVWVLDAYIKVADENDVQDFGRRG